MPAKVDITKCKGCRTCEDVCPEGAIKWDTINAVPMVDTDRCVECGVCVVGCERGAMEVVKTNLRQRVDKKQESVKSGGIM